ncbi:MAG: hypothetical protein M1824_001729 [Vezdaea acicularis]|nr:MAG: hypothetical protein M1824_001729 [Vezdaea acicularis]
MASTLRSLQTLKLAQLKHIAIKCGVNSSGTKSALAARLIDEVSPIVPNVAANSTVKNGPSRILSIDMGIRNLAYCMLEIPSPTPKRPSKTAISAWQRVSVAPKPIVSATGAPAKESFEPSQYSKLAYEFLVQDVLRRSPTHVLIERQRYRSSSSSAIQEWTVRVNMFEGMLYAVLHTLKAEQRWSGTVQSVLPAKVSSFWIEDQERARGKGAKAKNKKLKVDVVGRWMESGDVVNLQTVEAKEMGDAFLRKWQGKGRRKKGEEPGDTTKLDDLADCMLQGIAWLEWEKNRQLLLQKGVESL